MSKQAKIAVVGSINMDLVVTASQLPVAGETILGEQFQTIPGGKGANQAVAAARLGARVAMVGAVGDDMFGRRMRDQLQQEGVEITHVKVVPGQATGVAMIQVSQAGENTIVVVPGANHALRPDDIEEAEQAIAEADVMLVQLEIPLATVAKAVEIAERSGTMIILNPAPAQPLPDTLLAKTDLLTPNETELAVLTTGKATAYGDMMTLVAALKERLGKGNLLVTRGEKGVYYEIDGQRGEQPAYAVKAVDTTAAGDSFNAGLATRIAEGASWKEAIDFASRVAALTVTRFGAQSSLPTRKEVDAFTG
ncbi:ribokinase [Brevibacillus sp. SYP-B805]|uniref:ribokinase n=1 Tax=Brevibacillus sp. SYP-B805 TaxID=1578199 RepID=UPI0013ED1410|nr:ribokinase [Brevibacillus sp. SYP-B805]